MRYLARFSNWQLRIKRPEGKASMVWKDKAVDAIAARGEMMEDTEDSCTGTEKSVEP